MNKYQIKAQEFDDELRLVFHYAVGRKVREEGIEQKGELGVY